MLIEAVLGLHHGMSMLLFGFDLWKVTSDIQESESKAQRIHHDAATTTRRSGQEFSLHLALHSHSVCGHPDDSSLSESHE